jgi:hypothetical protein
VQEIREMALFLHNQNFTEERIGFINVLAVHHQADSVHGIWRVKNVDDHKASLQDMHNYLQYFTSIHVLIYRIHLKNK